MREFHDKDSDAAGIFFHGNSGHAYGVSLGGKEGGIAVDGLSAVTRSGFQDIQYGLQVLLIGADHDCGTFLLQEAAGGAESRDEKAILVQYADSLLIIIILQDGQDQLAMLQLLLIIFRKLLCVSLISLFCHDGCLLSGTVGVNRQVIFLFLHHTRFWQKLKYYMKKPTGKVRNEQMDAKKQKGNGKTIER